MKKVLVLIISLISILLLVSCNKDKKLEVKYNVAHNAKFGGFDVLVSIEDFCNAGFSYGDSIDIVLDNGEKRLDIPFYNGYYSRRGDPLLCAYLGYEYLHLANNNGADLYVEMKASENSSVSITLKEKGKYKVQQDVMDTVYSNDRKDFNSDEMFANYRSMIGGSIKENRIYRGVSPVNNVYNRALYLDQLIKKDGINFVLNLTDSEADIETYKAIKEYKYNESYFKSLYDNGNAVLLNLGSNFGSSSFMAGLGSGLKEMIKHEGPYYVHCTEGKDRTGFVCLLLEALCGASYEEIKEDYMITYYNYYGISTNNLKEKYDAIVELKLYDMIKYLTGEEDILKFNAISFNSYAESYLKECGLNDSEIGELKNILIK